MSGPSGGFNMSKSKSDSGVQFFPGQENALAGIFAPGGVFEQYMGGKPNAGFARQQTQAAQELQRAQAAQGTADTTLGTRQLADFLTRSTAMANDDWLAGLFQFMQPAGSKSSGSSSGFGVQASV